MTLIPTGSRPATRVGAPTILAVADTSERVGLTVAMLDRLSGAGTTVGLAVARTDRTPSPARIRDATEGSRQAGLRVPVLTARQVRSLVRRHRPGVVLLNCSGPLVETLSCSLRSVLRRYRPVVVSALPALSLPAAEGEWLHRSRVDLLVAHSRREVAEYSALGERLGVRGEVGLGSLPLGRGNADRGTRRDRVVYAAHSGAPDTERGRRSVLLALTELAESRPDLEVVVHLGHEPGNRHPFVESWRSLVRADLAEDHVLVFRSGRLSDQLDRARGLVAVGSSPVVEALAHRVPTLVLTDFGVGPGQGNAVFEDSGLFGTLADVRATRFRRPSREWGEQNHFHPSEDDDWVDRLRVLHGRSLRGELG
ncbi:DUF6716 putative glycosyltransferase [Nocardiopsis sp. L17-MgMaSL7]|uniref:DUF6716 putative glycosyltransferase n=1 Tax=Nocardiopsis sp. L17-MgMaSL7 TaxID=1938893 RepID=UPI000D71D6F4|nr:DUF6716 putative glycosyltransferase [Nocardiopsis sp. L17-MgMaSL7]PWV51259.1 hypothetical protein BDW27_107332 [Nocardiopsis sp. L17-MgMaSL7]